MSERAEFRERGIAAIRLLQGAIYAEDESTWSILLRNEADVESYFAEIGLSLVVDRSEGIAYVKQLGDDERCDGYERLPRLFHSSRLTYETTLLCVLLRDEYRRFEDEEVENERCVVESDALFDTWKSFFAAASDEITLRRKLTTSFNQIEKLKFVRKLKSESEAWEVCKLLKARVPMDELENLKERLLQAGKSN